MNQFDNVNLIHRTVFQTLDKHARESGYKDWNDMKLKNKIERTQSFLIEELIRLALNKFNSEVKQKAKS